MVPRSSKVPLEIWDHICESLAHHDLAQIIRVNRPFHSIAEPLLYRHLVDLAPAKTIACLRSLCRSDRTPSFVRTLEVRLQENTLTVNFFHLLNRTFKRLHKLTVLLLDVPTGHEWIWEGCNFRLKQFSTSVSCDAALTVFLDYQPAITELSLRGFDNDALCALRDTSLPMLTHFRPVYICPRILAKIVRGRPVESVSLSLTPGSVFETLDVLRVYAPSITRLSIMTIDARAKPGSLLPDIAERLPQLEALHIVVLVAEYTSEMLRISTSAMRQFKALKYLTLISSGALASVDEEYAIVTLWHEACPSLKTIILPQGRVWFEKEGEWI